MQIRSEWVFDCEAQHIWPNFLQSKMDATRPILFRFGIPKPMSCKVLEGEGKVGNTRQCTTDLGTIDQRILTFEENRKLRYRMIRSTVWCRDWVGHLEDEFSLTPLDGGRTRVERQTEFKAAGWFSGLKQIALWAALRQAHVYAARNWRRLATERMRMEAGNAMAAQAAGEGR
ncbi:hypothetical protein SAMN03159496_01204 [Rhizobium sp. NFR07]|uniref:SRPBCC family protein n=1 Tax=Rhizobium sp. NFR07 TaxID=1566262 RepID=UPI0008E563F1|nr:SRPBCC family protein [Rhizobium sp. NFR07]SFA96293.1 hypothetical protein SAMN03159496_01204 [Rhizobium sp. NFR07]